MGELYLFYTAHQGLHDSALYKYTIDIDILDLSTFREIQFLLNSEMSCYEPSMSVCRLFYWTKHLPSVRAWERSWSEKKIELQHSGKRSIMWTLPLHVPSKKLLLHLLNADDCLITVYFAVCTINSSLNLLLDVYKFKEIYRYYMLTEPSSWCNRNVNSR